MDWMPQAIREGIITILFISGPLVILAAGLGLTIGVIQAATQVQEQTLGSAVKVIGLFVALIIFGFYMFSYIRKYAATSIAKAFTMVPRLAHHPKPRQNRFSDLLPKSDDEMELNPPDVTPAEPLPQDGPSAPIAQGLGDLREEVPINTGETVNKQLPKPSRQRANRQDDNIKKQVPKAVAPKPASVKPAAKPASAPAKPVATKSAPAKKTVVVKPVAQAKLQATPAPTRTTTTVAPTAAPAPAAPTAPAAAPAPSALKSRLQRLRERATQ